MARTKAPIDQPDTKPDSVTLESPYGWYDDDGTGHFYSAGQVVADAAEIAALLDRKAPLVGIE